MTIGRTVGNNRGHNIVLPVLGLLWGCLRCRLWLIRLLGLVGVLRVHTVMVADFALNRYCFYVKASPQYRIELKTFATSQAELHTVALSVTARHCSMQDTPVPWSGY